MRIATVVALIFLGWGLARALGAARPGAVPPPGSGHRRNGRLPDPADDDRRRRRRAADRGPRRSTLAVGGAFTAVVLGLAAQQTLGNLFAGIVLLGTRPVPGRRAGAADRRPDGRLDRGHRQLARPLLHHLRQRRRPDHGAEQRSCSTSPSCRFASRRGWTCGRASTPTSARARSRSCSTERSPSPPATRRTSRWRRSTATRSCCGSSPRRQPADGAKLAEEILAAVRQTDGRGRRPRTGQRPSDG